MISLRAETGKEYHLSLTVPPGTRAVVQLPAKAENIVTESGKPVTGAGQVQLQTQWNGIAWLHVPAGSYKFSVK
jgi:hypothetical protein